MSRAKNYFEVAKKNVLSLKEKIILRHLILPGHIECCSKKILHFLKDFSPDLEIILIPQYFSHFGFKSKIKPNRFLKEGELKKIINYSNSLKIKAKVYENNFKEVSNFEKFSKVQELIIDKEGKIAFKYPDGFALSLKKSLGGKFFGY